MNDLLLTRPTEWGPAAHDPDQPTSAEATARALAERYATGPRPDDN